MIQRERNCCDCQPSTPTLASLRFVQPRLKNRPGPKQGTSYFKICSTPRRSNGLSNIGLAISKLVWSIRLASIGAIRHPSRALRIKLWAPPRSLYKADLSRVICPTLSLTASIGSANAGSIGGRCSQFRFRIARPSRISMWIGSPTVISIGSRASLPAASAATLLIISSIRSQTNSPFSLSTRSRRALF